MIPNDNGMQMMVDCAIFDVMVNLDDTRISVDDKFYRVIQWQVTPDTLYANLIAKDQSGNYVLFRGKLVGENNVNLQHHPYRGEGVNAWATRWLTNQGGMIR